MLRTIAGAVLAGTLVAARAAADALPHDPATGKSIDGAAVLLGLDEHPDYTFLILDGGCLGDDHDEDEDAERLRRKVGERGGCGYRVAAPGVEYRGVSQDAPNAESDAFFALPARRFPVKDGKIPALDRVKLGTLHEWLEGGPDSPLIALGSPPDFIELHRFSQRTGFTEVLRVIAPCGAPVLELVRREWQLESGEVITQVEPSLPRRCTPEPPVPEDRVKPPGADTPMAAAEVEAPVAVAESVAAPRADGQGRMVVAAEPVVVAPAPAPSLVPAVADVEELFAAEPTRPRSLTRELTLGGVCLLVGIGAGLALRRRQPR